MKEKKFYKKDYCIKKISHREAKYFISNNHYSKGCSNTSVFAFGLFKKQDTLKIIGVSLWMNAPCGVAKKYTNTYINKKPQMNTVLTLSRFVLINDLPKNAASYFLAQCIKRIQKLHFYDCLVTYADTRQNHIGTIYKASNWLADGYTYGCTIWIDEKGTLISPKSWYGRKKLTHNDLNNKYTNIGKSKKYRFIYRLKKNPRQKSLF